MKTLLLNGCSFGHCWTPTKQFISSLGCDTHVNISKMATSFQRSCRTTVEWIAKNGKPEYVLIPMTFAHRWELSLSYVEDDLDGGWIPLQNSNYMRDEFELHPNSFDNITKLVDYYYGTIPNIISYWDKMFTEIIMLSGYLNSINVKHLMFDMCNEFDKQHIKGFKGLDKINLIKNNRNVIDIWSFCGNRFMWNHLDDKENKDFNIHHAPEQYIELEKYLLKYIESL